VDLSALIFVALAAAWAIYLIPKALKAHEVDAQTRSVDDFSDRLRVLARRDAVSAGQAELVVEGAPRSGAEGDEPAGHDAAVEAEEVPGSSTSGDRPVLADRGPAARRAAARRRRVLGVLLAFLTVTGALAGFGVIGGWWLVAPAALVVAWLVACRFSVRSERAARAPQRVRKRRRTLADEELAAEDEVAAEVSVDEAGTEEFAPVVEAEATEVADGGWDPVPITLPTYVAKEEVGRTVRTIDLDATGVWSSGRNEADSQLAREASETERTEKDEQSERRATGS
jgi:hypothetical protein